MGSLCRLFCLSLLSLTAVAPLPAAPASDPAAAPAAQARLPEALREVSGLAASRLEPGVLWTHEDSGSQPVLTAIGADGGLRGRWRLQGAKNMDWEDMASFTLDGKAWLLVADVGDNRSGRGDCVLYVVEEPRLLPPATVSFPPPASAPATDAIAERVLSVAWKIPVIFPDGPRDVEAVAVDPGENRVYLLAKRTTPHGLYALPLRPTPPGEPMAPMRRVGELPAFPAAEGAEAFLPTARGAYRAQPTGMDFSADGFAAVIVTYGDVLVYPRRHDELWSTSLERAPIRLAPHGLFQAEAVAFGADGREIFVTSEGAGAPLLRLRWRP